MDEVKDTMKQISEEDKNIIAGWFVAAKDQNCGTLPEFIRHLMHDYRHDYGTVCHALGAAALAAAWACNKEDQGHITGFQAGFVMWGFVRHWAYEHNECGLRILDFDKLLYPQYAEYFGRAISPDTWKAVQAAAHKKLQELNEDGDMAKSLCSDRVFYHWKSIVAGSVPFGLRVAEESL